MPKMRIPMKGYDWNPLRNLPRNAPCPCGVSGKKFKQCCLKVMPEIVLMERADEYREAMKTPHLVRFAVEEPKSASIPFKEEQLSENANPWERAKEQKEEATA